MLKEQTRTVHFFGVKKLIHPQKSFNVSCVLNPRKSKGRICQSAAAMLIVSIMAFNVFVSPAFAQPAAPTNLVVYGVSQTRHSLGWQDNAADETAYHIQRSANNGVWTDFATIGPQTGYPRYTVTGADPAKEYRYRIRTHRSSDNSNSAWSNVARDPDFVERNNIRVFFNTTVCLPGNCTPSATNSQGENDMAARMADLLEGTLAEYKAMGFRDPWRPDGADKEPVNLVFADGGGAHGGDGIRLGPQFMGAYNHLINIGDASSFTIPVHEYFHAVQGAYGNLKQDPSPAWMGEGHPRAIQDLVCAQVGSDTCVNVDDDPSGAANYFGEVSNYLGNPNRPVTEISYTAALFWTYVCQEYGSERSESHLGLDFIADFMTEADRNLDRDGIEILNATLSELGHTDTFEDVFKNFIVANYAKDLTGPNVPDHYQYVDETQNPGSYRRVRLDLDQAISGNTQAGPHLSDVTRWGARYFRIRPDAGVPFISVDVTVDSMEQAFFTLLAVKNNDLLLEHRHTGKSFSKSMTNDDYDEVILIVAGLDHNVNFRYAFQASQPVLRIVNPHTGRPALVGSQLIPEKFLARIEVLDSTGDPITGIVPQDFTFTVGTQVIQSADIVTHSYVQGQYWFVLRAPTQISGGLYDLQVEWAAFTDTNTDAINYTPSDDIDNVLVIDRSGSMNTPASKMSGAKGAAKLYASSWNAGDMIGVVSFADIGNVHLSLRDWNAVSRQQAVDVINSLYPFGATSIGVGLDTGLDELIDRGNSNDEWAMILLSDGINTTGDDIDDYLQTYSSRSNSGHQVPQVHTVAIGPDANRPDLQKLAARTGGTYHFVSEPVSSSAAFAEDALNGPTQDFWRDISEIFRVVSERISRQGQVLSVRGKTVAGEVIPHAIPVDAGASELVVTVSWRYGTPGMSLRDPYGSFYAPFVEEPGEHKVFRIPSPLPGFWELNMEVSPGCQEFCQSDYLVEASIKSDLIMDMYFGLAPEERIKGRPMPVLVSLTESGPVLYAVVTGTLTFPSGGAFTGFLFDDGLHGDGAAGDGLFGATINNTVEAGDYKVEISALGDNPGTGPFFRRLTGWFHMVEDTNADNDCFPDGYEKNIGLDVTRNDDAEDPDRDGLNNCVEYLLGLHPFDADTDDGGEMDGSEFYASRNGLEPFDDTVKPPRAAAYPGIGEIKVRFNVPVNVEGFDIYRATDEDVNSTTPPPWSVFQLWTSNFPALEPYEFVDSQVLNGLKYWYRLVAIGPENQRSRPSDPVSSFPRNDPYAPHGYVIINNGAAQTDSLDVLLRIYASDEWDPEALIDVRDVFDDRAVVSGVTQMMIANDSNFEAAVWLPFEEHLRWRLERQGVATVFVKFKDAAGNVSEVLETSILVSLAGEDDCVNAFPIEEGRFDFSTGGTTTDGPGLPSVCEEGGGLSFENDLWFCYMPSGSGDATISLCNQADFDTRIAVYQGCECPTDNSLLLSCNDDASECGLTSQVSLPVNGKDSYLIRVGGYGDTSGTGSLSVNLETGCFYDFDNDNDVDGQDLPTLFEFPPVDVSGFASEFGQTHCQ